MKKQAVLLASSNPHKALELNELLKESPFLIEAAKEKLEVTEDGNSFQENAYKKAYAFFQRFKKPVVADDSGLVVESLPDLLGIYSARFGGDSLPAHDKNELLLKTLHERGYKKQEQRKAYFVCYLCLYFSPQEIFFFEGKVEGCIGSEQRGEGGFGYDPIFIPDEAEGKTLAEIAQWKSRNSHRARASRQLVEFFSRKGHCQTAKKM